MPKVFNRHTDIVPKGTVYVGRPSKWGNKYMIGKDGTRAECVAKHKADVLADPELIKMAKRELRGKDVACFCAPKACHGDTLIEIANS